MTLNEGTKENQLDYFTNLAHELSNLKERIDKLENIQKPETYQEIPLPIKSFHSPRSIRRMLEMRSREKKFIPSGDFST